jgi:CBS domain-containing protein
MPMWSKDIISDVAPPLRNSDTGIQALNLMDIFRVSHLPIVQNKEYLGLISDSDIYDLNEPREPVGKHQLSLSKPYIKEHDHIYKALELYSNNHITVLPVLSDNDQYRGLILLPDLVQHIAGLFALNFPGGIIVLETNANNYTLSEIAQIVEGNNARILNMTISPVKGTEKIFITLKINKEDIDSVIHTFERYEYHIKLYYSSAENKIEGVYEDHYQSLLRYLNI